LGNFEDNMIKSNKVIPVLVALFAANCAHAIGTAVLDQQSKSDASNSGVTQQIGGGESRTTSTSLVFPSVIPGTVTNTGCLTSGTATGGVGWNLIGGSYPVQLWSEDCALRSTADFLLSLCQYKTLRVYMDSYWDKKGIDLKALWRPKHTAEGIVGPATYAEYVKSLQDMSLEECMLARASAGGGPTPAPAPPVAPTPAPIAPPATPTAAPTPAPTQAPAPAPAPVPPVVKQIVHETTRVSVQGMALFATNRADITAKGISHLTKAMDKFPPSETNIVRVEGRTDDQGSHELNDRLSLARATSVVAWLRARGYTVYEVVGFGKRDPLADGTDAGARAINRSVTIVAQKTKDADSQVGSQ
jgi:outer membrane protein OmpA-like peptidoglycan-associated protein